TRADGCADRCAACHYTEPDGRTTRGRTAMKAWAQAQAQALVRSRAWAATSAWIRGGRRRGRPAGHEIHGIPVSADVVAYFGDSAEKTYQLTQWLPVLERLNEHRPVLLVFRKLGALRAIKGTTHLP